MKQGQRELETRRLPMQERAKESVNILLSTAATLIDERGIEGFNTNLLAERAGLRVSAVYRYFPNKYAVIVALTQRLSARWEDWMSTFYRDFADPSKDWRQTLSSVRRQWINHAKAEPGSVTVLQAVNSTPELRELHGRIFDQMSNNVVDALLARGLRLPRAKLMAIARTIISSQNAAVELHFRLGSREGAQFLGELDAMLQAYLGLYLSD